MNPNDPTRQIIYENGAIAYAGPGHSFQVQANNGAEIKAVSVTDLTDVQRRANAPYISDPKLQIATPHGKGWAVRPKTTQELVDDGIIDGNAAEAALRQSSPKNR